MNEDRLHWWEEIPLALATIAQSVIVGVWYHKSINLGNDNLNIAVAIIAGLALDLIVVTTVMGRRMGRNSNWSILAAFGAFLCSALIAVDTYSDWLTGLRPLLHVSYPLMVLLYSQHLAGVRHGVAVAPVARVTLRNRVADWWQRRKQARDVQATITVDLVTPATPQLTATQGVAPVLAQVVDTPTPVVASIAPPVDMPRKQPTSKLAGVDVAAELRDRFEGNKQRMAQHYGVSRQAIDNRMKGVAS